MPGVLRGLYVGRRTGSLTFIRDGERRGVHFRGGNIVNADTDVREDRLGAVLVRSGRLTEADRRRAEGFAIRDRKRFGAVLVQLGLLDRAGLEEALALHVDTVMSKVFAWTDGRYEFRHYEELPLADGEVSLRVSTGDLILQAARSVQDPDVVRYNLGDLNRVLVASSDPLLRFQRIRLVPLDGYVMSRVDGVLSAREVIQLIPLPAGDVERSLFGLLSTGVVEFRGAKGKPAPDRAPVAEKAVAPRPHSAATVAARPDGASGGDRARSSTAGSDRRARRSDRRARPRRLGGESAGGTHGHPRQPPLRGASAAGPDRRRERRRRAPASSRVAAPGGPGDAPGPRDEGPLRAARRPSRRHGASGPGSLLPARQALPPRRAARGGPRRDARCARSHLPPAGRGVRDPPQPADPRRLREEPRARRDGRAVRSDGAGGERARRVRRPRSVARSRRRELREREVLGGHPGPREGGAPRAGRAQAAAARAARPRVCKDPGLGQAGARSSC